MTPAEIAAKAAEEVFRTIERDKRIIKANIAEAIERILLTTQASPTYTLSCDPNFNPAHFRDVAPRRPYDVIPGDNDHWSDAAWNELVRTRLRKAEIRRQADCKKLGIAFIPSAGYASICGND